MIDDTGEDAHGRCPDESPAKNQLQEVASYRRDLLRGLVFVGGCTASAGAFAPEVAAATLCVDPSDPSCYDTIQTAIDDADEGDTIEVIKSDGPYNEAILITKSITLIGDPGGTEPGVGPDAPVLDGSGLTGVNGISFLEGVSDAWIEGFEIRNYRFDSENGGFGRGISGEDNREPTANVTIRNNYVHDTGWSGIAVAHWSDLHNNWEVTNNVVETATRHGIRVSNCPNSTIANNVVRGGPALKCGILTESKRNRESTTSLTVSDISVKNNTVHGEFSVCGIEASAWNLAQGDPVKIRGVTIAKNTVRGELSGSEGNSDSVEGFDPAGIKIMTLAPGSTVERVNIRDNEISNSVVGVKLREFFDGQPEVLGGTIDAVSVSGNTIEKSGHGAYLEGDAMEVSIEENTISDGLHTGIRIIERSDADSISVNSNDLVNNENWGIEHRGSGVLDGTNNWWGTKTGPSGGVQDPETGEIANGDGDRVDTDIRFDPWLEEPVADGGPPPVGGFQNPPTDPDGDGLYEDINGDGTFDIVDVQALFANLDDSAVTNNPDAFDFNGDGQVDVVDVQRLFNEL
ncbi:right-handed parallel beta-helix repeat-containing protein [Salinirubrum litoreum]|uniref:Probable pectate lyase C n=1 Tax=Salinirubrum litoreum TaxID=1126234 RepID=A0ABD5R9F5_9EURY|nr:right-handed parallel beta-helix repeat-containing protein [Salinirubrum litoreum]